MPVVIYSGRITVQGPINSVDEDLSYRVDPLPLPAFVANPPSSSFVREAGASVPPSGGFISFDNATAGLSAKVESSDGAPWLSIMVVTAGVPTSPSVTYNVDARGLAAGTYTATIVGTSGSATARAVITLTVLPKPVRPLVRERAAAKLHGSRGNHERRTAGFRLPLRMDRLCLDFATKLGAPIQVVKSDPAANCHPEVAFRILSARDLNARGDEQYARKLGGHVDLHDFRGHRADSALGLHHRRAGLAAGDWVGGQCCVGTARTHRTGRDHHHTRFGRWTAARGLAARFAWPRGHDGQPRRPSIN